MLIAYLLVILLLAGGAAGGWFAYGRALRLEAQVAAQLSAGAAHLQAGKDALKLATNQHSPALINQSVADFKEAGTSFENAIGVLSSDPLLTVGGRTPGVGTYFLEPRLQTAEAVAKMGAALSDAGQEAAAVDSQLIGQNADPTSSAGSRLLKFLTASQPSLAVALAALKDASRYAAEVDPKLLPSSQQATFTHALASIHDELAGVEEFQRLAPVLAEVLGGNGPRTYLVEQVDPANLQGSGGYIGSYSILGAEGGTLKLEKSADVLSIDTPYPTPGQKGYVPEPLELRTFTGDHGWRLGDSLVSSDFPTAAKVGEQLYTNETGQSVDGVIAVDPITIAKLLDVTGPILLPEYNVTVNSSNFAEVVYQRSEFRGTPGHPGYPYDGKAFLVSAATKVFQSITTVPASKWSALLSALNAATSQRHLQVYFNNAGAEAEMGRIGWSGAFAPAPAGGEMMREVEANYGDSKVNYFVVRTYDLTLTEEADSLAHHLVVNVTNPAPPGYAGGRTYYFYVRLYIPADATSAKASNLQADKVATDEQPPPGTKFLDGWVRIDVNSQTGVGTHQFIFDWTTPLNQDQSDNSIYWQKQAGTNADKLSVTYTTAGGKTYKADSDLTQDRLIKLTPDGVTIEAGQSGAAQLPLLG
ncbi:MAG TPA: DUF4012 domain-containing protein [Candidatus Dormibacteraeota bacterium]|nr:DUF4012 domain-containing protein [Candidatus Dormibacteraeota bacterium]